VSGSGSARAAGRYMIILLGLTVLLTCARARPRAAPPCLNTCCARWNSGSRVLIWLICSRVPPPNSSTIAARGRERIHVTQLAAQAARFESGARCGGVGILAEREADADMAYLHGPPVASPAQPAVHDQAAADPLIVHADHHEVWDGRSGSGGWLASLGR